MEKLSGWVFPLGQGPDAAQGRVAREWKEEDCSGPLCLKSQRRDWLHMETRELTCLGFLCAGCCSTGGTLFPSAIGKGIDTAETTVDHLARIYANEH